MILNTMFCTITIGNVLTMSIGNLLFGWVAVINGTFFLSNAYAKPEPNDMLIYEFVFVERRKSFLFFIPTIICE